METGIHKMKMAEYLALPLLSSGICSTILSESPHHAKYAMMNSRPASVEMDVGSIAHAMLLEGGSDSLVIIDAEDWRTKVAQTARDEAHEAGKLPILRKKLANIEKMVKVAREFININEIADVFKTGSPEVTMVAEIGGVMCKARADHLTGDGRLVLSYKTTAGTANPDSWIRTQLPSHDVATVFYERIALAVCPDIEEARCVHLVQEQSAPWACSLVALSPALADLASRKLDKALAIWAECQKTGNYYAYPNRICYAEPTSWQEQEFADAEANRIDLSGGIPA